MALCIAIAAVALLARMPEGLASPRIETPAQASFEPSVWTAGRMTAEVAVSVEHSFTDGDLTIWSGKRRLLHTHLTSGQGSSWLLRMPAGAHSIRIVVTSPLRGIDLEESFTRSLRESELVRLRLRVKEQPRPRLDILWTDS